MWRCGARVVDTAPCAARLAQVSIVCSRCRQGIESAKGGTKNGRVSVRARVRVVTWRQAVEDDVPESAGTGTARGVKRGAAGVLEGGRPTPRFVGSDCDTVSGHIH